MCQCYPAVVRHLPLRLVAQVATAVPDSGKARVTQRRRAVLARLGANLRPAPGADRRRAAADDQLSRLPSAALDTRVRFRSR